MIETILNQAGQVVSQAAPQIQQAAEQVVESAIDYGTEFVKENGHVFFHKGCEALIEIAKHL